MSYSYPLDMPTSPKPAKMVVRPNSVVSATSSIFTGEEQVQAHQGQFWVADVELPPLTLEQAGPWIAFLLKLNGRQGTFYLPDPVHTAVQGEGGGTPLVDGASQTGQTLAIKGATNSQTDWLKEGDLIQVGDYFYRNLTDATTSGTGTVTLDIWPRLRSSPADGATVTLSNPRCKFRLASNVNPWEMEPGDFHAISFQCREAI